MGYIKDARQEGFAGNSLRMWKKREGRALREKEVQENRKKKNEK